MTRNEKVMNYEQAWQSVLGQLQMEMPRAAFDTWVRDTQALSLEDGMLTVGVRNAYARDWLENRLASTINRLLVGILNASVEVQFVVVDNEDDPIADDDDASKNKPQRESDGSLEIALADYDSVYEQVVRPNRAVYLPGYFRRWLKYLGPDLGWLYFAFRQSAYTVGARTGKAVNRFAGKDLARLAGIAERTFWYRLESETTWEKLKGLVKISDHGPQWDNSSSTPKRLPRRYTIAMSLPLTPVDTNSLSKWLASNLEQYGGPEGVLRAAVEAPLDELIPQEAAEMSEPVTVTELVRELFGGGELSNKLLDSLASAIQNHIMPQGDLIVVTLFFLEHILPHLGAGPSWMVTLLRDMCFVDPEKGETRNRVTVKGGYAEIAGWLGMSRPKTIWDWLNAKDGNEKLKNPVLRVFTREVAREKELDFEGAYRTFEVLIEDIPQEILEAALTNGSGAICSIGMAQFADRNGADCSIDMARLAESDGALCSIGMARFADSIGATCRVLSSLTLKTNSLNSNNTTTLNTSNDENEKKEIARKQKLVEEQGVVNLPAAWVLDRLLTQNKVHPKTQKTVRGGSAKALVSWLLYAFSLEGRGIDRPMNYALARLAEDPHSGAGDKYDELAGVPPADLIDVVYQASRGYLAAALHKDELSELARLWMDLMGINDSAARKLLRYLLGDQSPNIQTKIRRSERWNETENGIERTIEESIEEV